MPRSAASPPDGCRRRSLPTVRPARRGSRRPCEDPEREFQSAAARPTPAGLRGSSPRRTPAWRPGRGGCPGAKAAARGRPTQAGATGPTPRPPTAPPSGHTGASPARSATGSSAGAPRSRRPRWRAPLRGRFSPVVGGVRRLGLPQADLRQGKALSLRELVEQAGNRLRGRVLLHQKARLAHVLEDGRQGVVRAQEHPVVKLAVEPRLDGGLDLAEVVHHPAAVERLRLQLDLHDAVVPVRHPALPLVVHQPMAVAERQPLGDLVHINLAEMEGWVAERPYPIYRPPPTKKNPP